MELTANYMWVLLLLPFLSGGALCFVKSRYVPMASVLLAALFLGLALLGWNTEELRFQASWFDPLGLQYSLYMDAYSYFLILLSAFLTLVCVFYSYGKISHKVTAYHSLFHLLQGTVVACLLCDDLVFFYIFWEAMLIPMYFIIGIWGGPRRLYATIKFFLMTFAGSLLMLVGLISTYIFYYQITGEWTASFQVIRDVFYENPLPFEYQQWIFLSFIIAFAVKVPLIPLHTWLPDAHVEAPTAGSVILAGMLLKMGTYGLMRFAIPLFPEAASFFADILVGLSAVGILWGAIVAWRQTDIKKLIAYSSVSHLGFVTLGIFMMTDIGWNGAYLQMINHGVSTAALFLLVGFIYDQKHTRSIDAFGGVAKIIPAFSVVLLIVTLSSIALPGTNGFIGEFLILVGSFQSSVAHPGWIVMAAGGVILSAIYMLHLVQKLCYGQEGSASKGLIDFRWKDWVIFVPFILLIFGIGLFPGWLLDPVHESTARILAGVESVLVGPLR